MQHILLSADSETFVYIVPNEVADNLKKYCKEFCNKWLVKSPYAEKYRINNSLCYNVADFIEYLNTWIFPDAPSRLIECIGWVNSKKDIPIKYRECAFFNF